MGSLLVTTVPWVTGGPGKEQGTNKLPPTRILQRSARGQQEMGDCSPEVLATSITGGPGKEQGTNRLPPTRILWSAPLCCAHWMPILGDPGAHEMGVPSCNGNPREHNWEPLPHPRHEPTPLICSSFGGCSTPQNGLRDFSFLARDSIWPSALRAWSPNL